MKERARKAAVMREVWGLGKRLWGKDWEKRIWLHDTLIWKVMGYGVEVWRWKEKERIEVVQESTRNIR